MARLVLRKPLRIPRDWGVVTAEWMTSAIASRCPDARVSEVELVESDDGTNRRARFQLTYAEGSGPQRVFLKAHAANHRITHLRNGNLFNEARLFASGADLPIEHPLVYASKADYLRLDFLLVMEDLLTREADPRDAGRPLTVEQVAYGLRGLARLHSAFWEAGIRSRRELGWVKKWRPSKGWQVGLRKCVPRGMERGRDALPDAVLNFGPDKVVDLWVRYVRSLSCQPETLLHGDAHIGNTYVLPDDEVGFLDWQVLRRGNWSQDVGYFLVSALTSADRRRAEADLVELYRTALDVSSCSRPSRDEAFLWYRASTAYGLTIWLSTLGTDGYQRHEISSILAQRYAAAFVELDGLSALSAITDG
jgi:hypothetical protein